MAYDRFPLPAEHPAPPPSLTATVTINSDAGEIEFEAEVDTTYGTIISAEIERRSVSRSALIAVFGHRAVLEAEFDVDARMPELIREREMSVEAYERGA